MARNKTQTKVKLSIPKFLDSQDRLEIAERVIEFIAERSRDGHSVYGRPWSGKAGRYTEEYAKQKGVSKNGPVDLSLSHSMLDAMKYFKSLSKAGQITVGFTKGSTNERKAEGNIQGTYGQKSPIAGKARPFLDILKKDLNAIVKEYQEEIGEDIHGNPIGQTEKKTGGVNPITGERDE